MMNGVGKILVFSSPSHYVVIKDSKLELLNSSESLECEDLIGEGLVMIKNCGIFLWIIKRSLVLGIQDQGLDD